MILSTHMVAGAMIGAVAAHNLPMAAAAGFMSHFILDTIPHWDYKIGSIEQKGVVVDNDMNVRSRAFIIDLCKIGFDFLIGLTLIAIAFSSYPSYIIIGALVGGIMGMIPDPLQFVYWKMRFSWMKPLQRFHSWMHAKTNLNERPLLGIFSQVAIMAIILIVSKSL